MSKYLWEDLRDPKFWIPIVVLFAWGAAFLLDIFVLAFHGVVLTLTFPLLIVGAVVYLVYSTKKRKHFEALMSKQKAFEKRRLEEFRKELEKNPEFSTFCFDCIHFKNNRCSVEILNYHAKKVKFDFLAPNRFFCLYWNANEEEIRV